MFSNLFTPLHLPASRWMIALCLLALTIPTAWGATKNGFNLDNSTIPVAEIHHGGPPKDGIPAIDSPKFVQAKEAKFLKPSHRVLGLSYNGDTKAYPIPVMNWHEIVNDTFGSEPVVVTFCPLCGTGVAFSAVANDRRHSFGVSGLLYNSDVLLYDRETQSLWSQLLMKAVSGPLQGTTLDVIPLEHTTWEDWQERHPGTLVLSTDTGHRRDYNRDPYAGYVKSQNTYFPVSHQDRRYHPKEQVLGIMIDGASKAYPFIELRKTSGEIKDTIGQQEVVVRFSNEHQSARIFNGDGKELPGITAFWFAWYAFHPGTDVFTAQ